MTAQPATYEVLFGEHYIGKIAYPAGSKITTTDPLDKMFPGCFRKVSSSVLAAVKKTKVAPPPEPVDEEEEEEATSAAEAENETDEEETSSSAVSPDDVDVTQDHQVAVKKRLLVKVTPEKTYKVIEPESEELLAEGLSRTDLKKFLKGYEPAEK